MTYTTLLNIKQSLEEELWEATSLYWEPNQTNIELINLKIERVNKMLNSKPNICDHCVWKCNDACKICKEVK